jgi:hypothetical protein
MQKIMLIGRESLPFLYINAVKVFLGNKSVIFHIKSFFFVKLLDYMTH